jgi:hypothetical protein
MFTYTPTEELITQIGKYVQREIHIIAPVTNLPYLSDSEWERENISIPLESILRENNVPLLHESFSELCRITDYAVENCMFRAYEGLGGGKIDIRILTGELGYLVQVIDFGKGFLSEKCVRATLEKKRVKGVHKQNLGSGLDEFMYAEKHQIKIDSILGKGTTVTFQRLYN